MWVMIKAAVVLLFLFFCGYQDIREKRLSVKMLVLFGVLFLALSFAFDELSWEGRPQNFAPGMAAFVLAILTKEQIGYGDAACLTVLGSVVSADTLWRAVLGGLFLLSLFSMVLLLRKKAERKTTVPFIPFLAAGMVWQMIYKSLPSL